MQLPPVLWEPSCYWCHPLIIFHSCFQYPVLYEGVFSSFMCPRLCAYVCANIDCANTSAHSCVCVQLYKSVCSFVSVPTLITSLLLSVCLTTGAVSFDCIDSVLLRAVLKNGKMSVLWVWGNWFAPSFSWYSGATWEMEAKTPHVNSSMCAQVYVQLGPNISVWTWLEFERVATELDPNLTGVLFFMYDLTRAAQFM